MKVSTRIVSGFGVLMIPVLFALAYQVTIIYRMQSVNLDLEAINAHLETALRMRYDAVAIDEASKKFFLVNRDYQKDLDDLWGLFETGLGELQDAVASDNVHIEVARLTRAWQNYQRQWAVEMEDRPAGQFDSISFELDRELDVLRLRSETVYEAIRLYVREEVSRAASMGAAAERMSWIAGGSAIFIGILMSLILVRGINETLRQLTRGTRRIAQGQFWHRLPTDKRDEFGELATDFNEMCQRLGELDQMKKDFVSHVSHELKAPLASIRQTFHLLLEQIPGPLNDQQTRLLRLSYNGAERLAAMVGNLLDVSRLEMGTMEYSMASADLLALTRTAIEEFEIQAAEKNVAIRLDASEPAGAFIVQCDRDRMLQVIGNLLDNALKFSPANSEILVKMEREETGPDGFVLISVSDKGTGVPEAHREKIFGKFHQVKHGRKITGQGVGLGLAICKSIVEAHHGRIWMEENPLGGSRFCFRLRATAKMEASACG